MRIRIARRIGEGVGQAIVHRPQAGALEVAEISGLHRRAALREGAELLRRSVIAALVIGGLRDVEFGPGSLLVRHVLPVDPDRARGSAGEEEQQQDRGHPLHGELPCTAFLCHPLLHNSWT